MQHPKSPAPPPPTARTAGAIGLIFELVVHHRHRIGVTVAIFEFPSLTLKNGPPKGSGRDPLRPKNRKKKNFEFLIFFDWNVFSGVRIYTKTLFGARLVIFTVVYACFGANGTFDKILT